MLPYDRNTGDFLRVLHLLLFSSFGKPSIFRHCNLSSVVGRTFFCEIFLSSCQYNLVQCLISLLVDVLAEIVVLHGSRRLTVDGFQVHCWRTYLALISMVALFARLVFELLWLFNC